MCYPDRMAILYIPWHKGELCVWSIMVGFQCHSTLLKVYIFGIVASQQISNKQNIFYFFFQEDQDWGIVAMVLDRLFLWMFAITAISGSLLILSESPYIYDTTSPIDVVFSKIAQQEARIFDEDKLLVWDLAQPRQVWTQDHFVGHPMRDSIWTFILQCIFISTRHSGSQRPSTKRDNFR